MLYTLQLVHSCILCVTNCTAYLCICVWGGGWGGGGGGCSWRKLSECCVFVVGVGGGGGGGGGEGAPKLGIKTCFFKNRVFSCFWGVFGVFSCVLKTCFPGNMYF